MRINNKVPNAAGQLVWCPSDMSLGIGVVTAHQGPRMRVRFERLEQERNYTTRSSEQAILRYEIAEGERVHVRSGREQRVRRRLDMEKNNPDLLVYELEDGSRSVESELIPHIRDMGAKERLAALHLAHPEVVRGRVQGLVLAHCAKRPGHAGVLGTRVQWLPHQVDVATQALARDPVRLLLADEVGLGKTVEATMIYAGLRSEGRAQRVLIVTPESLCIQWLGEVYRKAHELVVYLNDERLEDTARDFPDLNPFEAHQRLVVSLDRLAADPHLAHQAALASWDVVIVDEAHHLKWRPDASGHTPYRLVAALAQRTRHMLLLTATPMALDPAEYHALLRLLDPVRFDDPQSFESVATRLESIRKLAWQMHKAADTQTPLDPDAARQLEDILCDDAVDRDLFHAWMKLPVHLPHRCEAVEPVMEALRQRHGLADCVVRNRRGPVGGLPARRPQVFALTPSPAQELLLDLGESLMLDLVETLEEPSERYRALGELLRALWATPRALVDILKPYSAALVQALEAPMADVLAAPLDLQGLPTGDRRLRWLAQWVRGLAPGEKLLVFVESALAVRALKDALEPLINGPLAIFYRELSPRDQDRQVAYFRDPHGPGVMLSTEAGGEGRNFQFCHQVVLYDMPWRPATVEQRIGRVDRVGQHHDVQVLVPYFNVGYEAAVLKIMQQSIGVLDQTIGGMDHALEYVSDRLADLILSAAPAQRWKQLYLDTQARVQQARQRIESNVDPILDHASFSPARADRILKRMPSDIEARLEAFVQRYAEHSKLEIHAKGPHCVALEGAPGAAGRMSLGPWGGQRGGLVGSMQGAHGGGYVGTFSRTYALDHEDVEFLSLGHPLLDQAMDWALHDPEASAALAVCRGYSEDGAVFVWCFTVDPPADAPEVVTYFDTPVIFVALDEAGQRRPEFESLLESIHRPLDRMDARMLEGHRDRWRRLVERNYQHAEAWADRDLQKAAQAAQVALEEGIALRQRHLKRSHNRAQAAQGRSPPLLEQHAQQEAACSEAYRREVAALAQVRPRLVAAVAVRLVQSKKICA